MPTRLNRHRHPDILRMLAQRKQQQENTTTRRALLPGTLDGLNAYGVMADTSKKAPSDILCFGPKSIEDEGWMAVVIWYRPKLYHSYLILTILGVWAIVSDAGVRIHVGTSKLHYSGQPYSAEAYFNRMQKDYETYYNAEVVPPDLDHCIYDQLYTPESRLTIRSAVQASLMKYWESAETGH